MGANRRANGGDCGYSESDRVSLAPYGDISTLQVHSTEGFPALWPSRLRKDLDRTSGSRQSCKTGRGVSPGCVWCEGGETTGDSRGVSPCQGARDSEYVAGRIGADGPGSFCPGSRSPERGGAALYLYRRGGIGARHEEGLSFIQHLQYLGANVLFRDGRDRVVARCGDHSGVEPACPDRPGGAATGAYRSQDQSEPSES